MAETDLSQILAALQATNQSITSLKATVEQQQETIAQLRAEKTAPATEQSPDFAKLQAEHNKLADAYNKQNAETRKEKQAAATKNGLLARGIDQKKLELAHTVIRDRVVHSSDGSLKYVDDNGAQVPLEVGLDQFCESENGAIFKPTPTVNGGGLQPFNKTSAGGYLAPKNPEGYVPLRQLGKTVLDSKDFAARIARTLGVNRI